MNFPHRTFCETLHNMRRILKHSNIFSFLYQRKILMSLIEELQVYGDRMEAGLSYGGDLERLHKTRGKLREEVRLLKLEKKELSGDDSQDDEEEGPHLGSLSRLRELLEDEE